MRVGSKREVYYSAEPMKTSGGLRKEHLRKNPRGRIVSIKRSDESKKNSQRLQQWWFQKKDMNTPSEK